MKRERYCDPCFLVVSFVFWYFSIAYLAWTARFRSQHVIEVRTLIWTQWYSICNSLRLGVNRDLLLYFGYFLGFWLIQPQLFHSHTIHWAPSKLQVEKKPKICSNYLDFSEFVRAFGVGSCSDCVGLAGLISGQGQGCVHRMFFRSQTLVPTVCISMVPPHKMDRLLWLQQIPQIPCPLWDSSAWDAQHILCWIVARRALGIEQQSFNSAWMIYTNCDMA